MKPALRIIAGRPHYARHGYLEAEPATAPADDVLDAIVGLAYLLLGALFFLSACASLAILLLSIERLTS